MPIKGLSEKKVLPRLGKIHLGIKKKNAKGVEYPTAVDYFVVPPELVAIVGEKPTTLKIMFPLDDTETIAPQYYKAYSQSRGLVCRGDGENANRLIDKATQEVDTFSGEVVYGKIARHDAKETERLDIECPGQDCEYYKKKECREIMNLQFMIPDAPGLGIWQLDTSSFYGMVNINSGLALISHMFGRLRGIPLDLVLEPREVSPDGKKITVRVLNIRTSVTLRELAGMAESPVLAIGPADESTPELLYPSKEAEAARTEAEKEETAKETVPQETVDSLRKEVQALAAKLGVAFTAVKDWVTEQKVLNHTKMPSEWGIADLQKVRGALNKALEKPTEVAEAAPAKTAESQEAEPTPLSEQAKPDVSDEPPPAESEAPVEEPDPKEEPPPSSETPSEPPKSDGAGPKQPERPNIQNAGDFLRAVTKLYGAEFETDVSVKDFTLKMLGFQSWMDRVKSWDETWDLFVKVMETNGEQ